MRMLYQKPPKGADKGYTRTEGEQSRKARRLAKKLNKKEKELKDDMWEIFRGRV